MEPAGCFWPHINSQCSLFLPTDNNTGMLAVEMAVLKSFSIPFFFPLFPIQFLRSSTQITWGALFRHEVLSRDPLLLAMIPKYLRASMTNLVKVRGNSGQIGVRKWLCEHGLWLVREKIDFYWECQTWSLLRARPQATEQTAPSWHFAVCSFCLHLLQVVLAVMVSFSSP